MTSRPFPTDIPSRESSTRKATVRTRVTARDYLLDFGTPDAPTETATWDGFDLLDVGTIVLARWLNEDGTWLITDVVQLPI